MNIFFCLRCSEISISDERLRCSNCESNESRNAVTENLNLPVPEPENSSHGYNVPATDTGKKKSEEDFVQAEPTQLEAGSRMLEENTTDSLQIAGCHEYKNCTKSESTSQIIIPHDFDQYNNENRDSLQANSNTNESEFHHQSSDICNATTLLETMDDKPIFSEQTNLYEQSSVGEGENKHNSDEFLRKRGTKDPTEPGIKYDSFVFTDSVTLESEYPAKNLLSDSSEKVEERQDKDNIPPIFSFCPSGNPSVNKCFQENSMTAIVVAQQKRQTSSELSYRKCGKCKRYFRKEWTFYAHRENYCNPRKLYKCEECGLISRTIPALLAHRRVHTGETPFKCTQCDYASAWPNLLKKHLETHTNIPPSFSSFSRTNASVNKSSQENLLTSKTLTQKNQQTTNKSERISCEKCKRYFYKQSTFRAHVRSNCHPNPFKCGQCDERFSCMSGLIMHEKVHTAEKPFKCTQCDYATKWPSHLKKHLETHR